MEDSFDYSDPIGVLWAMAIMFIVVLCFWALMDCTDD